jgi:thioredoxin-dependent peroxiredoxin
MSVGVGDPAPGFELAATGGVTVRLSDYVGWPVVLVFYPGDDTPVCTKQLNSYNVDLAEFERLDAQILGISAQSVDSHEQFADKHGFLFPLLSDPDKSVLAAYGTLGPLGFARRSVFIIDGGGTIRYAHRAIAGLTFRPVHELVDVLRTIAAERPRS